ncbi:MAG TPA: hypothetical protein PLJ27_06540 [Polyangiaceae bacterium]|jgi:hypothetical protein|nr:MAG: hypothetical protein BWY17_01923 [Deltaproteobacteria bacterium ADurb.Bin207]HNS98579.1 hypothetical protein [Polyangiaceae bacterium]HNZ23702.1 hypothetical protein [Polyangiaceae bacterium]HOD23412.1 hypothetical protein [Polyangiaceae bacterium]HOE49616.1 hypothetical protein [Polyangiaceae bacterium]
MTLGVKGLFEAGAHARWVDTFVIHQGLIGFRALCERVVPTDTRYLVLDLDRTLHWDKNIGELLGWELCAHAAYGMAGLEQAEAERKSNRFVFDHKHPWRSVHYVARGARLWAYPGLSYGLAIKLGMRSKAVRPWLFRMLGQDPVEVIHGIVRNALMHHLSEIPLDTARTLARRVWHRQAADQILDKQDLLWLRERCPHIRIIVSSASPKPVLDVAAEELGVDEIYYTSVEEHDGYLSAPHALDRWFMLWRTPKRICPPSQAHTNAGERKMLRLLDVHPDFLDPGVVTVGMTDTSYREDHSWANYFKILVDLHSPTPFVPIVSGSSPLMEIHSAHVMTQAEKQDGSCRRRNHVGPLDERRYCGSQLERQLPGLLSTVHRLNQRYQDEHRRLHHDRLEIEGHLSTLWKLIEEDVDDYNASEGHRRDRVLRRLRHRLRQRHRWERRLIRTERPLAELTHSLTELLSVARLSLEPTA